MHAGKAPVVSPEAEVRKREVVTGAAELFDRQGYHATSVEDVAAAVGLRKSTLYHYFGSKEEILYWIHEELIELLLGRLKRRSGSTASASESLLEVVTDGIQLMDTHRGHMRVFFEHYRELNGERRAVISRKRRAYQEAIEDIIRDGIATGEFRDVDSKLAARALFGMINWTYQWYHPGMPVESEEVAQLFWDLFMRGLQPR